VIGGLFLIEAKRIGLSKFQVPIICFEAERCPGDIAIGDADGLIISEIDSQDREHYRNYGKHCCKGRGNHGCYDKMEMVYVH